MSNSEKVDCKKPSQGLGSGSGGGGAGVEMGYSLLNKPSQFDTNFLRCVHVRLLRMSDTDKVSLQETSNTNN